MDQDQNQYCKELFEALLDAFPSESSLDEWLWLDLDVNVREVTPPGSLRTRVMTLVRDAKSAGELDVYLKSARTRNPGNPKLKALAEKRFGKPSQSHIPSPPEFYPEPSYLGSHKFVGRSEQLETLDEWAAPTDSHAVLLYEAIGGTGKSMLTWHWVNEHAPKVQQWRGRFWYSFYERGAVMADFCAHALAYMTGEPLEELQKEKTAALAKKLLQQLQQGPWLLVLDGLERVLVAYHRADAAQLQDEEAGRTDEIAQRDPCAAIRPEDDDLLRRLATAGPSKLLLTSRLIPRVLLNAARQPIPGVLRERLPGLRPADAEALFHACGVSGGSKAIRDYLKAHCDCHPLTIGVLAGLVQDYLPERGNFDRWAADPAYGGRLNLAELDLVQKRNHILRAALDALSAPSRQLLATLALISEAVDATTLEALNPHLPPEIEKVEEPEKPEEDDDWDFWMSGDDKAQAKRDYEAALKRHADYEQAVKARRESAEYRAAPKRLLETVKDLERRGLLQYDAQAKHYDLHPVVRGIASGGLALEERQSYGKRLLDHFSARPHDPYEEAETLEDVRDGLHVVRTLQQMGRWQWAADVYVGDLARALHFNLEANAEVLALLKPFFAEGWDKLPVEVDTGTASYLANSAAIGLGGLGEEDLALAALGTVLSADLEAQDWQGLRVSLSHMAIRWASQDRLAKSERCYRLALDLAGVLYDAEELFRARLHWYSHLGRLGKWTEGGALWASLDPMERPQNRAIYRSGDAEHWHAQARFWQGQLWEEHLARAEHLAREGRNRESLRAIHHLRGAWRLERGEWALAAESLQEAVQMARAVGQIDAEAETQLALARLHLGQLTDPRHEAEQLARASETSPIDLAEFWLAIGDPEQAKRYAMKAYELAWADGEPYVHRYDLEKARALLEKLGAEVPVLPPYDPAKDEKLPWEDAVVAAIQKLREEKEEEERQRREAEAKQEPSAKPARPPAKKRRRSKS